MYYVLEHKVGRKNIRQKTRSQNVNKQIIYKFSDLLFRNIYIAKKCNINIQNTWINLNPEKIIYYNLKIIILTKHIMVCLK